MAAYESLQRRSAGSPNQHRGNSEIRQSDHLEKSFVAIRLKDDRAYRTGGLGIRNSRCESAITSVAGNQRNSAGERSAVGLRAAVAAPAQQGDIAQGCGEWLGNLWTVSENSVDDLQARRHGCAGNTHARVENVRVRARAGRDCGRRCSGSLN